jgi:hypothetical protein
VTLDLPLNVALVAVAVQRCGGRASLSAIYQAMRVLVPDWKSEYKSEDSFEGTIRATLEQYCPQSERYSPKEPAFFERVGPGQYRIIPADERAEAEQRGRGLRDRPGH